MSKNIDNNPHTVCILAGGLGTRLGSLIKDTPKPLIRVAGKPFLHHQLDSLSRNGVKRVVLCVGYLGEQIEDSVGNGKAFGLDIAYSYDGPQLLGTAGAIRSALDYLGKDFMVMYGDSYLRLDYLDVYHVFYERNVPALMTVLHNRNRWDASNATYEKGFVTAFGKSMRLTNFQWIDYGVSVLNASVLANTSESDLSHIFKLLAKKRQLAGYAVDKRFYHIGTPESMRETENFLRKLDE